MPRFSSLTGRITGEGADAWLVHEIACDRLARGEDVIVLSIGDPDFDTPPAIVEAAVESVRSGRTHYAAAGGHDEIVRAVAAHASRLYGREISQSQAVFFPGAQSALFAVCNCLLERGDEAIVQEPTYVTYEAVIGSTGAGAVPAPLRS